MNLLFFIILCIQTIYSSCSIDNKSKMQQYLDQQLFLKVIEIDTSYIEQPCSDPTIKNLLDQGANPHACLCNIDLAKTISQKIHNSNNDDFLHKNAQEIVQHKMTPMHLIKSVKAAVMLTQNHITYFSEKPYFSFFSEETCFLKPKFATKNGEKIEYSPIQLKANINAQNALGLTPLHAAIIAQLSDVALFLIESGADIEKTDCSLQTALHKSVYCGESNIIERLLEYKANILAKDINNQTALDIIETANYDESIKQSIKNKLYTALFIQAIDRNDFATFSLHFTEEYKNRTIGDIHANSLLHHAVYMKNSTITEFLLDRCARINIKNKYGNTPLHIATLNNDSKIVELLLKRKANMYEQNKNKEKPCEFISSMSILKLFLEARDNQN